MNEFPERVTLHEDGIYRWSYEMDMRHNLFLLKKLLRVIGVITFIISAVLMFLIFGFHRSGGFGGFPGTAVPAPLRPLILRYGRLLKAAGFTMLIVLAALAVTVFIYAICTHFMHGVYRLYYEMDNSVIALMRSKESKDLVNTIAMFTAFAARSRGSAMTAGTLASANASVGITPYSSILSVKLYGKYDVIDIWEWGGGNQIYVHPDDFAFVRDFILDRVKERIRNKVRI